MNQLDLDCCWKIFYTQSGFEWKSSVIKTIKKLQAFNRESRKCIYKKDSTFPHEKLQQLVCTCASHQRSVLHLGRTTLKLVSSYVDPTSVAVFVIGASFFRKQWNIGPEQSVRYLELDFCKCCCNLQTVARPFF